MSIIFDSGIFDVCAERHFFSLTMSKLTCVIITNVHTHTHTHTHTYIYTYALYIHTHVHSVNDSLLR